MFGDLQDQAFFFSDNNMAYNSHSLGISPETFESDEGLKNIFDVIAVSYTAEPDSKAFVAAIEGKDYPFFGTQFHPEMTS